MIIPEATILKIKEEADIVEVIGEYIKLEKKGGDYKGVCPFHADTNPSLSVSPSKKIYKCFSCGASGNVYTFVQNYENVSFPKAVQIVGEKCGIKVELDGINDTSQNLDKYYKILQEAANFYEFFLKNTTEGKIALKYLYKRKLNDDIIKRFKIGLAPKEADLLYKSLINNKFQPLDMIESGVIRSANNYYDVFRNRIIFPIEDIDGHIVGFSGRIYQNKKTEEAKYLNSSENIVFKKGNILYNFKQANNEIRHKDQVFVFEGFMDVIAAYRANIHNAIATMGTSLTQNQIKAISKLTKNVVICFDGDRAGIEAARKAIYLFTEANFNVKSVLMPDGLDPDEYIDKYSEDKLYEYLNNQSLSGIDYLYEVEKNDLNLSDINSIENFKKEIFSYLKFFDSNVINEKYLQKLSEDLKVSIESLQKDFSENINIIKEQSNNTKKHYVIENKQPEVTTNKKIQGKFINSEKYLIKLSYKNKDKCMFAVDKLRAKCVDKSNRDILFKMYDYYKNNNEMVDERFQNFLEPFELKILIEILNSSALAEFIEINQLISRIDEFQSLKYLKRFVNEKNGEYSAEDLKKYAEEKGKYIKFIDKMNKE